MTLARIADEPESVAGWHAVKLLGRLRAAGFTIRAEGDKLIVAPMSRLTADDVKAISGQRLALLAVLKGESVWVDPAAWDEMDRVVMRQVQAGAWREPIRRKKAVKK